MDIQSFNFMTDTKLSQQKLVLTIGNFDGIHTGHQVLLKRVSQVARQQDATAGVLTFDPHPSAILRRQTPPLLTTQQHKWLLMEILGIQKIWVADFNEELASMSTEDFVYRLLQRHLKPIQMLVGQDFRFGFQRRGDSKTLFNLGKQAGFSVEIIPTVSSKHDKISSSVLRNEIASARFQQVASLLKRPYSIVGTVQHGNKRGHSIGFPTINLQPKSTLAINYGVFACQVFLKNKWYDGVCNYGIRPTFQQTIPILEAHLFDYSTTCYNEIVEIVPRKLLRPEKRFSSPQALTKQLKKDCQQAKVLLPTLSDLLPSPLFPAIGDYK